MLKKENLKANKFFIVFFVVMAILSGVIIYSGKSVFSAFLTTNEIVSDSTLEKARIDDDMLEQAYKMVYEKNSEELLIK